MFPSVPVKLGLETVPLGVPLTDTLPLVPVKVGVETLPLGVNVPVELILVPENTRLVPVPVKLGWDEEALSMPVTIVLLEKLGRVTAVGVFAVKLPSVHVRINVSPLTLVPNTGMVALACVPLVTLPPPVALDATYPVEEVGVTVMVGVDTVPAGV